MSNYFKFFLVSLLVFLLPFEIIGVNEDLLYIISFVIFFYNVVNGVSDLAYVELLRRQAFISNIYHNTLKFQIDLCLKLGFLYKNIDEIDFELTYGETVAY
jgi:hypothetical protein